MNKEKILFDLIDTNRFVEKDIEIKFIELINTVDFGPIQSYSVFFENTYIFSIDKNVYRTNNIYSYRKSMLYRNIDDAIFLMKNKTLKGIRKKKIKELDI